MGGTEITGNTGHLWSTNHLSPVLSFGRTHKSALPSAGEILRISGRSAGKDLRSAHAIRGPGRLKASTHGSRRRACSGAQGWHMSLRAAKYFPPPAVNLFAIQWFTRFFTAANLTQNILHIRYFWCGNCFSKHVETSLWTPNE